MAYWPSQDEVRPMVEKGWPAIAPRGADRVSAVRKSAKLSDVIC
jgi:hypothetical protein